MTKPYIVCHMMSSVDGRIDCAMTAKLPGVDEYYSALSELKAPVTVSGRVTAELELGTCGHFTPQDREPLGHEAFAVNAKAENYSVVTDTDGTLRWKSSTDTDGRPLVIVTGEQVSKEYLSYLNSMQISWIACGKAKIDQGRAAEILNTAFGADRIAVVGGGNINAAFLSAGLIDEISLILAPAVDGRGGMAAVFDGLPMNSEPFELKMKSVTPYENGVLWLRYKTV